MSILILLRHGQSEWNLQNRFTGWTDVKLTKKGKEEAKNAGALINESAITIDSIYCSILKRAVKTCKICLKELKIEKNNVNYDWRLNERHYGALQGMNKSETAKKFGDKQVLIWRRSFNVSPPELELNDERHPSNQKLFKKIDSKLLPNSESLKDTLLRVKPLLEAELIPKLKNGKNLIVVAHGNSLRAIVKILKNISNDDILKLNIPTGTPYIFELNSKMHVSKDYYLGN